MKNDRSSNGASETTGAATGNAWTRFWFAAIPQTGLRTLRVFSGLIIVGWLLSFAGHQSEFFSLNGVLDSNGYIAIQRQDGIAPAPIGWSILFLAGTNAAAFQTLYWGSIAVVLLFTLGVATRITGVATWIVTVSFFANPAVSFEGDYLLGILAFYMMLGHLFAGQWNGDLSLLERLLGSKRDFLFANVFFGPETTLPAPSMSANWMMRLLQIHFAIIMVANGLHKLQISDWWSGVALWYPLHPPFQTTMESIDRERASAGFTLFYLSLLQYVALSWQIGFPAFAWKQGYARVVLVGGAAIYWLGVFFVFRLPLFGPFVMVGCLSFLAPEEWAAVADWVSGWFKRETPIPTKAQVEAKRPTPAAIPEVVKK